MINENENNIENNSTVSSQTPAESTMSLTLVDTGSLDNESLQIINQIITEQDAEKVDDLTYLFNRNHQKKVAVRVNKLDKLMDVLTDKLTERVTERTNEITTTELMQALKTIGDISDKSRHELVEEPEQPKTLIQVNETNVNVGDDATKSLDRSSREKVKNAVLAMLGSLNSVPVDLTVEQDVIDVEPKEQNDSSVVLKENEEDD